MKDCICGSNRAFNVCCQPFLSGKKNPRTVKQLMRSRYSAYALGNYEEYLINTWHPQARGNAGVADLSLPNYTWKSLEIIEHQQQGDMGRVEFKASYSDAGGPDQIHHEKSAFYRVKGAWLYLDGEVYEEA